jgi:hypothetical protein
MHPADKDRPPLNGSIPDPDAPLPFYGVISIPQEILYGDESEPLDDRAREQRVCSALREHDSLASLSRSKRQGRQ